MSDSVDPTVRELQLKVSILEDTIRQLVFKNGGGKIHYQWRNDTDLGEKAPFLKTMFKTQRN